MIKRILVTGGTGYIGSHTVVLLIQAGYDVVILDNLSNSSISVVDAIRKITGCQPEFIQGDIRDTDTLIKVFSCHSFDSVIHFAGLKAAGESVEKPLTYYDNNVNGSIHLLEAMLRYEVRTLIFSSSATVYGIPQQLPLTEDHPLSPVNPYGQSKLVVEDLLAHLQASTCDWRIARLRYFNPVGAHPSALIGESPQGIPNNLMPYIAQVAAGKRPNLSVFGHDYDTPDGTGVRDYIHVMDLARGHIAALQHCDVSDPGVLTVNLGTGNGYSVLEMVRAFEKASGRTVPFEFKPRRPGDVDACWADTTKALKTLGWQAALGIDEMCSDVWRWESGSTN